MTLYLKLSLNHVCKLKSNPNNPPYTSVFYPTCSAYFENHEGVTPPLSHRVEPHLESAKLAMERVELSELPITPPWLLDTLEVVLSLTKLNNSSSSELFSASVC